MRSHCPGTNAAPEAVRQHLADMIRRVEAGHPGDQQRECGGKWGRGCVQTGWDAIDRSLPVFSPNGSRGLARGAVHEWMGLGEEREWLPPLDLLAHLASCAAHEGEGQAIAWVGRRCWPHPCSQRAVRPALIDHSIFIEPENASQRQWAIELCLRSPAVCAVVADASGLSMAESRRLQLAAEAGLRAGGGGFALLTRPAHEAGAISAATTRWIVRRERTPASPQHAQPHPRWRIELRRCKGMTSHIDAESEQGEWQEMGRKIAGKEMGGWVLEGGHETGIVCLSTDVVDQSGSPQKQLAQSA